MKEKNEKTGFVKGAFILMLFGLISKIIGAVYRIPLTRIIGTEGIGLYQMVFPLYTLMLTVSSSGIPSSISKLISENLAKNNHKQVNRILTVSFILLACFSLFASFLVAILSKQISNLQGNVDARICYLGISPAIVLVGLIAGFRGYFQGKEKMFPSAFSGLIEQAVKMVCGIYFASLLLEQGVPYGVLGALVGIAVSELVALVYLLVHFYFDKKNNVNNGLIDGQILSYGTTAKQILKLSIFVTLGGLIMPLTMLIDSGLVINILKRAGLSVSVATKLFGLQSGTVGSIINMPVILSLSLSTAVLPCVSRNRAKGDGKGVLKASSKALFITIILSLPSAIGCFALAEPIVKLLYGGSLTQEEIKVAASLLEIASFGVFYLAMLQVSTGLLQGLNRFYIPLISLTIGGVVKIILNIILIRIPSVGILGAEFATVSCYLIALFINLIVLTKMKVYVFDLKILYCLMISALVYFARPLYNIMIVKGVNFYLSIFLSVITVVIIYFLFVYMLFYRKKKDKFYN